MTREGEAGARTIAGKMNDRAGDTCHGGNGDRRTTAIRQTTWAVLAGRAVSSKIHPESSPREPPKIGRAANEKRRSPPIKLKEDNGSKSIETFFQQFRTCVAYYCWTDEDMGVYLRCKLTGDAANLLWAQPDANDLYYDDLERRLRGRFGCADQEDKF